MRESFVFHFEYLEDIPEEFQTAWAMYVINYARDGSEPLLDDWRDVRMWKRIKERIDAEGQKYEKRCRNLRNSNHGHHEEEPKPKAEEVKAEPETKTEKPKAEKFEKPTAEEVKAYAEEKNMDNVDAERFVNYYESKGWKVGKAPMKSWKAAVANWNKNRFESTDKPGGTMWGNESDGAENYAEFF